MKRVIPLRSFKIKTISVRLPDDLADRLDNLADRTGRPKSFYFKEMLTKYMAEYEAAYLALEKMNDLNQNYMSTDELEREVGL